MEGRSGVLMYENVEEIYTGAGKLVVSVARE